MKSIRSVTVCLIWAAASASGAGRQAHEFQGPPGLQLYSLRDQFKAEGVAATLDRVKAFGFKTVELAGTYGLPTAEFKTMLDARGLDPVSGHFPYDRYRKDPQGVAKEAKALGLKYAGCAWANHKAPFDEKQCRETIEVFNRAGEALAAEGIRFFYHLHGYEFHPHGKGTLADLLITECAAKNVSFQMDVLWVILPGHDPAALLEKYSGRWVSMHMKDLRKGIATGDLSAKTDLRNNVVLGTGQADWSAILRAAGKAGVKHYFIEDESPDVVTQIPSHLKYLESVRF